jgi:hypothetical protein
MTMEMSEVVEKLDEVFQTAGAPLTFDMRKCVYSEMFDDLTDSQRAFLIERWDAYIDSIRDEITYNDFDEDLFTL